MLKSRGGGGPPNSRLEGDRCDVTRGKTRKNATHFPSPFLLGREIPAGCVCDKETNCHFGVK